MKKLWCSYILLFGLLIGIASSQDSWNLGSSEDWLSTGPIKHVGPYYIPNSDLPVGTQKYLNTYPGYMPFYYWYYYPAYSPYYYQTPYRTQYPYYYPYYYYPYYYYPYYPNSDSYPLGTFGLFHGGSY